MIQRMWRVMTCLKYAPSRQRNAGLVDMTLSKLVSLPWLSSSRSGLIEQNLPLKLPIS